MGAPLRTGVVCAAIWVVIIAGVGAQPGDNLQTASSRADYFPTLGGVRRFINGPTSTSVAAFGRLLSRTTSKGLERIGGRVEDEPGGTRWLIKGHSYDIEDDVEATPRAYPGNGHTGGGQRIWRGEATQEGPHHPITDLEEQGNGRSVDQTGDERPDQGPDTYLSDPGENKSPPAPDADSADWARESSQWTYQESEWQVMPLSAKYPSSPPSSYALFALTNHSVEVERNVSGLANVTLHYRFLLSENQDPDTKPELKVYHVVNGTRTLLQEEVEQGDWQPRTIDVPEAANASILFEAWRRRDGDVIALRNVETTGVMLNKDEPLDLGDEMTLTAAQPKTTETFTSTPTEGNRTQDSSALEDVSPTTDEEDQDNIITTSEPPADTQVDPSLNSTANTSQSSSEGEVVANSTMEMPLNSTNLEAQTDDLQNETQISEQINASTDIVALNSSLAGGNNTTSGDGESDFLSSTTPTDEGENETDEEAATTIPATDGESDLPEPVLVIEEHANTSSGVTTNTSVASPATSATNGPLINTEDFNDRNTSSQPPARTGYTDKGQAVFENVPGSDDSTSQTTLETPRSNETSVNIASPTGVAVLIEGTTPESMSIPSAASNSTGAVTAVPVSSTSWQVFQVFLALCVLGLLALGFLYWKRKRRQDDEIPVFTRHTDYHNPTFSMEDAANFMSRSGRNTYKTID